MLDLNNESFPTHTTTTSGFVLTYVGLSRFFFLNENNLVLFVVLRKAPQEQFALYIALRQPSISFARRNMSADITAYGFSHQQLY